MEKAGDTMTELKTARKTANLTQKQAAEILGVSLRSYISYENDPQKMDTVMYQYMLEKIQELNKIDEEHGVLSIEMIKKATADVCSEYLVDYCYLFGSYANGTANEKSDVDLLISTSLKGLSFYELVEKLRDQLHKKVDVLDLKQLLNNESLLNNVLKEGIKIYG